MRQATTHQTKHVPAPSASDQAVQVFGKCTSKSALTTDKDSRRNDEKLLQQEKSVDERLATAEPIALYVGEVFHERFFPQRYRFNYRVFSFLVDIDQLDLLHRHPLVSFNRFNVFSLYYRDHGARNGQSWRFWIDSLLSEKNLTEAAHTVRLLCFPRVLGYAFNPLSAWFCYDKKSRLLAVINEVSNTFGESHHYLLHNNGKPLGLPVKAEKKKVFHVSPFINMNQQYRFVIDPPDDRLQLEINEYENGKPMLFARQSATRVPFSMRRLLFLFVSIPFMTLKIIVMIHWHALRIWIRGGRFYRKPQQSTERVS